MRNRIFQATLTLSLILTPFFAVSAQQQAQNPTNQPPKVTGTVQEIKETSRSKVVVIANEDGQTLEVPLGRVAIDIRAAGDKGFIRPGTFIGGEGVLTNDMLFVPTVNVFLPSKGQKLPRGVVRKAPRRANTSQNSYSILGTITAVKPNPDYPDYTMLAIDAPGRYPTINLEKTYTVKVSSANPELLTEGMQVELEGQAVRGRMQVTKIVANRAEPFKSEEVFAAEAEEAQK